MKIFGFFPPSWFLPLLLGCLTGWNTQAALKAGFTTVDITPPVGWRMSGYFYERLSTNVHDPLQAKIVFLQQGADKAALVFCDLIGISRELSARVRQGASRKAGLPRDNILLAATHTHTGPLYFGVLRDYFHQAAVAKTGEDPWERLDYPAILAERLVDGIGYASRHLQPVDVEVGRANQTGLSFNRRYLMRDGSVVTNPGQTNRNIVRPAGPIDPEIGILLFLNPTHERTLASLTCFGLHPDTVGGAEYSADYPFYLERSLKKTLGPDAISFFANSACGDVNHIDVSSPRLQKGQGEAERIGTNLAAGITAIFKELKPLRPSLAVAACPVRLPLQHYDPDQVAQARTNLSRLGGKGVPLLEQAAACKITGLQRHHTPSLDVPVQVIRLGAETALVAIPGELFVELSLSIKKGSPFKNTFVIELANDCINYIPTRKAFAEGSYETVNSIIQPGGGEQLVQTALGLLHQLR